MYKTYYAGQCEICNWASEASPTLGCSIEISRDIIGERARHSQVCSIENRVYITRIMVTIKKRAGVIPYSFSSSIALLSSLLSCSFYLLDLRTISRMDILEMT